MENRDFEYQYDSVIQLDGQADTSRKFIANVFMWMFVALGISAFCAYLFLEEPAFKYLLVNPVSNGITGLGLGAMFLPLAFVMIINYGANRIAYPILLVLFLTYSAATGISLSIILTAFTASSILGVFLTSMVVFGLMAVAGYTTNQDLTKFGSIMIMLLVGLVAATIINFFLRSEALYYITSYIGVAVFIGLTAFDVQKLKRISAGIEYGSASAKKTALLGALTLYLDFINLFIFMLRIFGGRK